MVRDLLDDLARDVPNYADPDRALAAGRAARRRTRAGLAGVVAALALVAFVVWTPPHRGPAPDGPLQPSGPVDPSVQPSGPTLPGLPDGAVGPARLAYRLMCRLPCSRHVIVLTDGTRYSLDDLGDLGAPSLSPNGRLLAAPFGQGTVTVRDLGSPEPPRPIDASLTPGVWEPMAWSPDSRYLVLWGPRGTGVSTYTRIDLADRTLVTYQPPEHRYVIAVLPSGELLLSPIVWSVALDLDVVDPATGATRPVPATDLRPWLEDLEVVRHDPTSPAMVSADGSRLTVVVRTMEHQVVAMMEFDLATGARLNRYELSPSPTWTPVAYSVDGPADGGFVAVASRPTRAAVIYPRDGAVVEYTELLPPRPEPWLSVLVPGGHSWY